MQVRHRFDGYARTQEITISHTNRQARRLVIKHIPPASFEPMNLPIRRSLTGDKGKRGIGMHDVHRRPRWCMLLRYVVSTSRVVVLISSLVTGEAYVTTCDPCRSLFCSVSA